MLFAGPSCLVLARRLVHRCGEASVAASAAPAAGNHKFLIGLGKLESLFSGLIVVHNRADRNLEQHVAAVASGFVGAFAVTPAVGLMLGIETEMHQRVVPFAGLHDDVSALAAVSAGGAAARNKFLAPEGHATVAAVTGFNLDFCFVDEHRRRSLAKFRPKNKSPVRRRGPS